MAGRTQTQDNASASNGTAEGNTVARTQRAKAQFSVYEQLTQVDVYDADTVIDAIGAAYAADAGGSRAVAAPTPRATDATALVLIAADVEARRGIDACWQLAEGQLRDRAESEHPPVLVARNQKDGGTTAPAPYALEKVVQRRRAS